MPVKTEIKGFYTLNQLARMYGVSRETFRNYLRRAMPLMSGLRKSRTMYSPKEVEMIFQTLGEP